MTLSLIYAAGEQYRLATDSSRPFGNLVETVLRLDRIIGTM